MPRLSQHTVHSIAESVEQIPYDRAALEVGIVHLGIGAFHRAHQAMYTDNVLRKTGGDWMIAGASLRSSSTFERLKPQDFLYTVNVRNSSGVTSRLVGSIKKVIYAGHDGRELMSQLIAQQTKIVSLTVTEKGYYLDASTGRLDITQDDIVHDLKNPNSPRTAIGYLVEALRLRRDQGLAPFTPLSCDNLHSNGNTLKHACVDYARELDEQLAEWINTHIKFPGTMVDRIVPAMTDEDELELDQILGLQDKAGLFTEGFCQWVIEDNFVNGRPAWEDTGVILCKDIRPFEEMKLRLLNGAHSAMAYLGYLGELECISDCMSNPSISDYVTQLLREEIAPEAAIPQGFDLGEYIEELLVRFRNKNLRHRCYQIAMDGSQKIPVRLLRTISERLNKQQPIGALALAVAAWMIYVTGIDLNNHATVVQDPLAEHLQRVARHYRKEPAELVSGLLDRSGVFDQALQDSSYFREMLVKAVSDIIEFGPIVATTKVERDFS